MDVVVWLRSLGLGKYEAAFRENDIDETVLPGLTHETLKELGVASIGHRVKLLDAIAALRAGAVNAPTATAEPARPTAAKPTETPIAGTVGERRHITVLFCDLVGSTSISAGLDAEDWRDLVGSYLDAASAAVTEMGGHVAKKLGDGLMALFGYPVAQENDAERAARAGLSIQRSLAEINRKNTGSGKPALNARIGIETGPVVVDASGEIYGDAPNTAARVQALAETGAVLVTAGVQRQIAGLFVAEERGTHELKGVPEPVTLFRLARASGGGRRAGQRHLTPLIGREEEIAVLMRRWERARNGDGQLVLIVGEPGLGKSRLIEEFHTRLGETPHTWVEWSCSQLLQNTPLHPIAEWGRQRFGSADIPAEQQLAELENTLGLIKLDPAENTPLLAPLLDIPLSPERAPALPPEELRRRQLAALTNLIMAGARTQPDALRGDAGESLVEGETGSVATDSDFRAYVGIAPDLFAANAGFGTFMTAFYKDQRFDGDAFLHQQNPFARRNVTAIVLEVPSEVIGKGKINAWATISLFGHAPEVQVSRWGLPMVTHLFLNDPSDQEVKEQFNASIPSEDLERFAKSIADFAEKMTTYAGSAADPGEYGKLIAARLCPDTLPYELGTSAAFEVASFNGRALGDDALDVMLTLATNTPLVDGLAPDRVRIRKDFPYYGAPYTAEEQVGVTPMHRPAKK